MASTEPEPLTLLRVKRARTHSALDALHVHRPLKRPRGDEYDAEQCLLRFRRLPQFTDLSTLGPSQVIDVDPTLLRTKDDESSSTGSDTILYNGTPLLREFVEPNEYMFDLFADGDNPRLEHLLDDSGDENIAWVHANNLPIFDNDSSDDDLLSDSDDRSVDYPSTPEISVEEASEDEWRERERITDLWQYPNDHSEEDATYHSDESERDYVSEQDGDNYDYEA